MLTRAHFGQQHGADWGRAGIGLHTPPLHGWRSGLMIRGGAAPIILPPPVVMMDPSDPTTWTTPVRFT